MKSTVIAGLLLTLIALPSLAGDSGHAAGIHVDVSRVVAEGGVQPVDGITSAGQPDAAALRVFADAGYVAVIDIRGPDEDRGMDEQAVIEDLGLEYVTLPIVGSDAINFDNARALDALLAERDGPVLVHCGSGNRVGALLALRKSLEGADDDAALEYGRSAGLGRLEPVVKERLKDD
jgi:uncharacterized protein (TIGR01244 family)